ncbi:MAG: zinc ribbon domain-containing protein [Lachnospiraceae bacterium]|nr:zinc ribbon domain-containing protein [Lachnospiraceae bacterium]
MAEYFKFCPKCGRVLDRDFCPHCEPEKEKAYRRQQQKQEQGMFEDYSRDSSLKDLFAGDKPKKKIKYPGKTITKKIREFGLDDTVEPEKEEKKGMVEKIATVFVILSFVLSLLGDVFDSDILDIILDLDLPDFVEEKILSFTDHDLDTITENNFRDLSYDDSVDDYTYKIRFDFMEDDDQKGSIRYKIGSEDLEYGYSISRPVIYDEDDNEVGGDAQKQIDVICQQWYEEGRKAKQEKKKVNAFLTSYVTYLDDNHACIVLDGTKDYDNADSEYLLDSFVINLEHMTVINLKDNIILEEAFGDEMLDDVDDDARAELKEKIKAKEYAYSFDQDGDLWISFVLDHYGQNINMKYPDFNMEDIRNLEEET